MGGGGNVVKSHTPNDPLVVAPYSRVSCLRNTYYVMNNRGLQGLVGRACGHLDTAVHDSIAPREHVINDCYTSEVFYMHTSDKYHT